MAGRFSVVIAGLVLVYAFLAFHLYELQLKEGAVYAAQAESQHNARNVENADRGTIYFTDRNGNRIPAALNKDFPEIYAVPNVIEDVSEAVHLVQPILGETSEELMNKLSNKTATYVLLAKKVDSEIAARIAELKLKGIYVDTVPSRFYPQGPLAAQILGFVGPDEKGEHGHYGIEEFYDVSLADQSYRKTKTSGSEGGDITLTIDPNIQMEAEHVLKNLVFSYKAQGGSIIVADPLSGKIFALGNIPSFDPNNYGDAPLGNFLNPVVQQVYEPGSIFKVLTMAAGIDSGKITPETTYVDKGSVTLNGRTIQNYDIKTHGPYGRVTMTSVVEHSINTGAVFAERQIGRDIFTAYMKAFGLGEKTGITLPGEVKGDLRRLSPKERDIAFATASYGQGVAVTPLELLSAISAIANGGNLMRPFLDASLTPEVIRRVISADTGWKVTQMMISAVDKAEVASVSGYTIAGKTGTAYVPDFKKGGYTDNVINTYVGFGPASDPKFIILIKLNEPQGAPVAGLSVVPAFRDLAQFVLNYFTIPPDRLPASAHP